jgi:UPF0755 protein
MTERRVPEGGGKPAAEPKGARGDGGDVRADGAAAAPKRRKRKSATTAIAADAIPALASVRPGESVRTVSAANGPRTVPRRPRGGSADAYEAEGKRGRPVLKLLNGFLTFFAVVLLGLGGAAYYLVAAVDADGPLKEPKLLVVPRNDGTQQIAERLEKDGMVGDKRMFLAGLYGLRLASMVPGGRTINLKAGEYEIKPGASIRAIVDTMSEGRSVLMRVTVPEGLTSYQIIERLKTDASLTGDIREVPAEGSLLPETYSLPRGSSRQTLIEMMQAAQKKLIDQLWTERQENLPLKSPAEALVLASVIEKETGRNDERDRVAAVFVNRLRKGMKLQSDPTILYGLALGKVQWGKTIFQSEIQSRTAHNTYVIPGLPPTPICNPGRATIEATLKPAATNELFFVADGRGGHVFAETNKQHEANVAKWRQVERERAGAAAAASAAAPAPAAPAAVTTINSPSSKAGASSLAPGAQKK